MGGLVLSEFAVEFWKGKNGFGRVKEGKEEIGGR